MTRIVQVAVGVVENPEGEVLIARRPATAHQGGLWEFPGGKVDPGESLVPALARELKEELAIEVLASEPLIDIHHDYPDKSVWLQVRRVTRFKGQARGNEGQPVRWVAPDRLEQYDFPAANRPIINALCLPNEILVTGPAQSTDDWLTRLSQALEQPLAWVQCRWPEGEPEAYRQRLLAALPLCRALDVSLIANCPVGQLPPEVDGLHLNSRELWKSNHRPVPRSVWLGASCHNERELAQAHRLEVDYVTLSPVLPTRSHPDAEPMGWERLAELTRLAKVPVYAQGGLDCSHISAAKAAGAQGISGIGFAWPRD